MNDKGVKIKKFVTDNKKKRLINPKYFRDVLNKNVKAKTVFEGFSYTNKKEYIEWIADAKTGYTKEKRMQTTMEWLALGKPRNWKHMKK